jgi:antitoxin component YwqK of YwqJK toxin-antitoxin module
MAEGQYFETKKEGHWKYYNDLETLSAEESYQKGTPTGVWKTYYDDGKLLEECPYLNGLKQGLCKQYFSDGSLKSELNFDKGKYEGPAKHYYPDGKPMLLGQWHNDLKEGTWTAFKDKGEKESEIEYRGGEVVNEIYYDKAREEELKNDVKEIPEK